MANDKNGKEVIISSITINKLDKGCTVEVTRKIPDAKSDYGDGYKYERKSYTADDDLLDQVVDYVDPIVDGEVETGDDTDDKPRLVDGKAFLKTA